MVLQRTMKPILALLVVLATLLGSCFADSEATSTTLPQPGLGEGGDPIGRGDEAPAFVGELLAGEEVTLDSLNGKPVVVNFWLTTCEPCLREMPLLADLASTEGDELAVLGVNFGEGEASVEQYLESFDVDLGFPIVLDRSGEIGSAYGIVVFPTTYFIDRDGVVQYRRIGELADVHLEEGLARIR